MKTVRDACKLQPNALTLKLSDQIEQLDELIHTEGDGTAFFEKTFITQGMQDLMTEGIARLASVSNQAVFHLKQAMGGGKTHLLVGFGLLAKHPALRKKYCGGDANSQMFGTARVAAFNGRNSPPHFFWGEIAQQLDRADMFQEYWASGPKAPDEKAWLKLFDGKDPILILLDEMSPYFEDLATRPVGAGTVADIATRAFANLLTAAGKKANVCVVISDLFAAYQSGGALINRALDNARQELGRAERNITPVDLAANEIYDILRKRLFTQLPDKAEIDDIADAYGKKLEEASKSKVANRGAEAIADEIVATYPFHPRLKNVIALFKENEQFKQTRGLIELVSRLLRSVWDRKANDIFLIGPQHFDLSIAEVRDKLTEISGMRDVIAKDLWDVQQSAHAQVIDLSTGKEAATQAGSLLLTASLSTAVMRFGHCPRVADTFCGSGQIPFEAARLGCDVDASDLNPIACLLTWGALNIVGGSQQSREKLAVEQSKLVRRVQAEVDSLGAENDGNGWVARVFLYCAEVRCPQSGWLVPLLPSRVLSTSRGAIAELVPDEARKRYDIRVRSGVSASQLGCAENGTIGRDGKYGEAFLIHQVDGITYKTKLSTLRGDRQNPDGTISNRLRLWEKQDYRPKQEDLFQERLYCVQWMRPKPKGKGFDYEFRAATPADLERERILEDFVGEHISEWQAKGWVPDMRIEVGGPPRYQGLDLIRARGWTHWNHVFTPRMLFIGGLIRREITAQTALGLTALLNCNSKMSRWNPARDCVAETFDNQALNTLFNYACQSFAYAARYFSDRFSSYPVTGAMKLTSRPATERGLNADIYITDPPYGDAVKYEEILDFFIAWLRKSPPPEFSGWVWDSRRSLAIKGEDEDFRRGMVATYKKMTECMPNNGIQVIMFTHQSPSIWSDMANIIWASGLRATAVWYVVTETDSALREASNVKGTWLLVLRKRQGTHKTTRDDLAWEIQEEVERQIHALTGLNQDAKGLYRDENVFEDADIQMAGYAAALRVLTRYATIDGRDMTAEAIRPRVKGETTFVDGLITFARETANKCLVPHGIPEGHWKEFTGAEQFYLKLIEMEAKGLKTLDNYQNFAKAFKVRDFRALMGSQKANEARLRSAVEFGKNEMSEGSELYQSILRAVLYAVMELAKNVDGNDVLAHLTLNVPDYYSNQTQRERVIELADYLAKKLETLRPEEASAARVLREMVKNQRLG